MTAVTQHLVARDEAGRNLSGGAIAGIIVGIVVVFLILLGLLIWRLYTYRTNRDLFTGRVNARYPSQMRQHGHVRSTRLRDSTMAPNEDGVNEDEKHLVGHGKDMGAPQHSEIDLGHADAVPGAAKPTDGYPSETNRASWWWPYGKADSLHGHANGAQPGPSAQRGTQNVHSEVMQPQHATASSTVGNVDDAHVLDVRDEPHFGTDGKPARASYREGCSTQ